MKYSISHIAKTAIYFETCIAFSRSCVANCTATPVKLFPDNVQHVQGLSH